MIHTDRRGALKGLSLAAAALWLPWGTRSARANSPRVVAPVGPGGRALRIAHITDVHVQPELTAGEGFSQCLSKIGDLSGDERPDVIFNTGDCVMDAMDQDEARTRLQWELWQKCLKDGPQLPIEHCLGNHDIWGVNKKKSKTTGEEPRYGKKWACEVFGMEKPYRRFDRAGWAFIVLDSVFPLDGSYQGRLDPEQMEWFKGELKAIPSTTPIMILSHIPILTVTPCISGHLHQLDHIELEGVTYLCNGAVSGAWWKGKRNETDSGYALIDLFPDGRVQRKYIESGWVPATS